MDSLGLNELKSILDSIKDGIVVVDEGYRVVYANSAASQFAGLSEEELRGKVCHEVFFRKQEPCGWCKCEECMKTGEMKRSRVKLPTDQGEEKVFEILTYPWQRGGAVCHAIELARDVTESARLEAELRKLATIADSSADAMMCVDSEGNINFWNRGAESLFGYRRSEVLGRHYSIIVPPELRDEAERMREEAYEKGSTRYETQRMRKDGSRVPVDMTLTLIKDEEGRELGIAGNIKDLSEKLKLQEDYKNLFENARDGISLTDREGRFVMFNSRFVEMTGYDEDELLGKPFLMIVHPRDRERVARYDRERLAGEEAPRMYEFRLLRKDGSSVHVEVTASPVLRNNEIVGTQGILRDLSEREMLEQEVRETKEHLESIIDTIDEAICVIDRDLTIISYNSAFAQNLSTSAERVLGRKCYEVIHGFSESEFRSLCLPRCTVLQAFEKGEPVESLHHHDIEEGRVYHESKALPTKDLAGNVYQVVYIIKDLTEKKMAEEEIKRLKEFNESIVRNTPIGILTTDDSGRITSANPALLRILGEIGESYNLLEHPSIRRAGWDREFKKVLERGEDIELEGEYVSPQGKRSFIRVKAIPLKDEEGKVKGLIGIAEDVSERKALEEGLREHARKLERSNKLKDLFADILRHDLLNPLGVIKNVFELIEEDLVEKRDRELAIVMRNVDKIEELVHTAARFGQLESAEEMEFEERDLGEILREAASTLERAAEKKGIRIALPEGRYPAEVSPFIEDAVSNLISNAIKYSPEQSEVLVSVEDEGERWKVKVADHGPGVPDEHKKDIFERFKRVEKGSVKGSGLGLAIVKKVVELHGGEVWVEDNIGKGSIFMFTLPKRRK